MASGDCACGFLLELGRARDDFSDGLVPDIPIKDNLLAAVPFGDFRDPMLAKALEDITGIAPASRKAALPAIDYILLPDPRKEQIANSTLFEKSLPFMDR